MRQKLRHNLGPFIGVFLFAAALWALHHELQQYHYHEVMRHIEELPTVRLLLALVLTVLSYLVLTGYDLLSFRYIHHLLSYRKIALASFVGYAFSHSIGLAVLTGGSIRYRFYSTWGLSTTEITSVVAFNGLTFWLGFLTLGGLAFLLEPLALPAALHLPFTSLRPLGGVFLLVVATYVGASAYRRTPFTAHGWEFHFPTPALATSQVLLSCLDWALAGSVLYVLLPPAPALSYPYFLGMYLLAQLTGLVSQIPGGLGVFETIMLMLLAPTVPAAAVLASLFAYRGLYYFLPFVLAAILLGAHELRQRKDEVSKVSRAVGRWIPLVVPHVLAFTTFLCGAILLYSGATPAIHSRLRLLKDVLPLPIMEISHFLGSFAGVGLLLLARGLQQRLDAAYFLTVILLSAGSLFSLLRGLDYEEALALAIILAAFLPCRRHFYRKSSLLNAQFSPGWIATIVIVLAGSIWLGLFSHKHVKYAHELWWQFAVESDAPRFLRATVGAVSVVVLFATVKLLRPAPSAPAPLQLGDMEKARAVVAEAKEPEAHLALLGDKELLFSEHGNAFIMYGVEGCSWVALGDPVGPESEIEELAWRFRELSDRHGGWTVFYEISKDYLPLYLDLGLSFLKFGEHARVPLTTFSLEGKSRRSLRSVCNHLEKEGCALTVIPATEVADLMPELKVISDAWLAEKNVREKGFSLGFFNPAYLQQGPVAVVRKEEKIVAFANLWLGADKEELSPDLMRFLPDAPESVMEYLFLQLMLWGKQEGYRWFNLGMAPLSGLEDHALAPLWNRLGAFIFRHGEHFYNFQGLRHYKEKFDPEWEPRYLASPGGFALPRILTNIAALISAGMKEAITK
jgi:phosphatidylglycerol lysyltransferase